MIGLLFLLGAVATDSRTAPVAIDPGSWITASDYPSQTRIDGTQGNVAFRLSIDTSGKPDACGILTSSGSQELDVATCELLLARARFKPAVGQDGKQVRTNYSSAVHWMLPD